MWPSALVCSVSIVAAQDFLVPRHLVGNCPAVPTPPLCKDGSRDWQVGTTPDDNGCLRPVYSGCCTQPVTPPVISCPEPLTPPECNDGSTAWVVGYTTHDTNGCTFPLYSNCTVDPPVPTPMPTITICPVNEPHHCWDGSAATILSSSTLNGCEIQQWGCPTVTGPTITICPVNEPPMCGDGSIPTLISNEIVDGCPIHEYACVICELECGTLVAAQWLGNNEGDKSCHKVVCLGGPSGGLLLTALGQPEACPDALACTTTSTTTTTVATCELECGTQVTVPWLGNNTGIKSCHKVVCVYGPTGGGLLLTAGGQPTECPDASPCTTTTTTIATCELECGTQVAAPWHGNNTGIKSCLQVACVGGPNGGLLLTAGGQPESCPGASPCATASSAAATTTTTTTTMRTCELECGTQVTVPFFGNNEGIKSCQKVACVGGPNGGGLLLTAGGQPTECPDAEPCPSTIIPTECSDKCNEMALEGISNAPFAASSDGTCVNPKKDSCRKEACKAVGIDGILKSCGTACEPTCADPNPICNKMCVPNVCQCKGRQLRNAAGKCVRKTNKKCKKERGEPPLPQDGPQCLNVYSQCADWKSKGHCANHNKELMAAYCCEESCPKGQFDVCHDYKRECAEWKDAGHCTNDNAELMQSQCCDSCRTS